MKKQKIIIAFTNALAALSFLILPLNFSAGIIGGIWLIILGKWEFLIAGILLVVLMPLIYSLTFLVSVPLTLAASFFHKKGRETITYLFAFLGNFISNLVIAYWVFFVFKFFIGNAEAHSLWAFILWGYSTMHAPLAKMAHAEGPDNLNSSLSVWLAMICYLMLTAFLFWSNISYSLLIIPAIAFTFINITHTLLISKSDI